MFGNLERIMPRVLLVIVAMVLTTQALKAQPAYWQFSPKDLIPGIELGKNKTEMISNISKRKKNLGKYSLSKKRVYVDSSINFVDYELLTGSFTLPETHKLQEWFDEKTMIINYSILFINDVSVRIGLYFIYPNVEMGAIDENYSNIVSFFSQVGWYPFCGHPMWDFDIKCGYQTNYVPLFEAYKGEDAKVRMYKYRLKISKGLCATTEHALSESIEITMSDAEFLKTALKIKSLEKAALYGTTLFGFGLDKQLANCSTK